MNSQTDSKVHPVEINVLTMCTKESYPLQEENYTWRRPDVSLFKYIRWILALSFFIYSTGVFADVGEDDVELISPKCMYCYYQKQPNALYIETLQFSDGSFFKTLGDTYFCNQINSALRQINWLWYSKEKLRPPFDDNFYPLYGFNYDVQAHGLKGYLEETYDPFFILDDDEEESDFGTFYVEQYFTRYSPIHLDDMMFSLEKDFFSSVNQYIDDYKIDINALRLEDGDRAKKSIQHRTNKIKFFESGLSRAKEILENTRDEFTQKILQDIENCLIDRKMHPQDHSEYNSTLLCDRGYANFLLGNYFTAMEDIKKSITTGAIDPKIFEVLGQTSAQLGLYQNAIDCLTKVIKEEPQNSKAYLERAAAYFEQGNFEKALEDYMASGLKGSPIEDFAIASLEFGGGVIQGVLMGAEHTLENFLPSMLCSLQGMANGIWAFALSPKEVSNEMVEACKNIYEFLQGSNLETISAVIPELKELVSDWKEHTEFHKGELVGTILGKYGLDVFLLSGSAKGIKLFQELKVANATLTLEAMKSLEKRTILKEISKQWNESLKVPTEAITKSKREVAVALGKQYRSQNLNEMQARKLLHSIDIPTFPTPNAMNVNEFRIQISKRGGGMRYISKKNPHYEVRIMPGNPSSEYLCQRKPYIVHRTPKGFMDKNGNIVPQRTPEAHIPLEEYDFSKVAEVFKDGK